MEGEINLYRWRGRIATKILGEKRMLELWDWVHYNAGLGYGPTPDIPKPYSKKPTQIEMPLVPFNDWLKQEKNSRKEHLRKKPHSDTLDQYYWIR